MNYLQSKLAEWIEDVNREDGITLQLIERMTRGMFFLIKWAGIPFVLYLMLAAANL